MESIGIKLADGSFYPILEDGKPEKKNLALTTVKDNQTTVHVDLYRSKSGSMDDAEYVDTLEITNLNPHGNGEPSLNLDIELDKDNKLNARINDPETGLESVKNVTLISRTAEERNLPANFSIEPTEEDTQSFEKIFNGKEEKPEDDKDMSFEEILNSISEPEKKEDSNPFAITEQDVEDLDKIDEAKDEQKQEETEVIGPAPNSEDFAFDDIASSQTEESSFDLADFVSPVGEEAPVKKNIDSASEEADSFEDVTPAEDAAIEETNKKASVVPEAVSDADTTVFDLPDFDTFETVPAFQEENTKPEADVSITNEKTLDTEKDSPVEDISTIDASTSIDDSIFNIPDTFPSVEEDRTASDDTVMEEEPIQPNDAESNKEVEPLQDTETPENPTQDSISELEPLPDFETHEEPETHEEFDTLSDYETPSEPEPAAESTQDDTFELPAAFAVTEVPTEEAPVTTEPAATADDSTFELPSFDESPSEKDITVEDTSFDLPDFGDIDSPDSSVLDLPDFSSTTNANERVVEPLAIDTGSTDFEPFELPSFDEDSKDADFTMPVFDDSEINTDFVLPDFGEPESKDSDQLTPQNMFSDLYDKETLEGKSSSAFDYEETKKQSKVPVVICLICALICLMSLLFLFVLPTNLNLITKIQNISKTEQKETDDPSDTETADIQKEREETLLAQAEDKTSLQEAVKTEKVQAKENEIVIATTPSQVVPAKPAKPAEKIPDTKYTVVWGDTLWDISNAYYKNPWRYTYLAEYNHLKNPNYIKAGSVILIPAE